MQMNRNNKRLIDWGIVTSGQSGRSYAGPRVSRRFSLSWLTAFGIIWLVVVWGCRKEPDRPASDGGRPVVVYCSVDEMFARDVLDGFRRDSGINVQAVFDSEAGTTTGLVNRIIAEAESGRPRGDVFWSGELFNTILLARQGLLEPYDSPAAVDIPDQYRDAEHRWTSLAMRARVIAFDPERIAPDKLPERWEQLAESSFASLTALANPMFGTTRGHVAAMFALWGPDRGRDFLTRFRDAGGAVVDGNSTAVRLLVDGRVSMAATDTDDVYVAQRGGARIDMRYLDMGDGGTLLIPSTVAIIKGGPNSDDARKVVGFLVSAEVERLLAESDWRSVPVRASLREELTMEFPPASQVDPEAVADAMEEAVTAVREILIR
jgi:iron(III) transport system substrate-binding protein